MFPPAPPPAGLRVQFPPSPNRVPPELEVLRLHQLDLFYAPLSARLLTGAFSPDLNVAYDEYRSMRLTLLEELRDYLARVERLDPGVRIEANEVFGQIQAARIEKLEAMAEQLRVDLIGKPSDWFFGSWSWGEHRKWKLGVEPLADRSKALVFEMQVMRAATFFEEGLSPGQRRLLREVSLELEDTLFRADQLGRESVLFFFEPDSVRVGLSFEVWPELAALIADYSSEKDRLKYDLRESIYLIDKARLAVTRQNTLEKLAREQASAIEALSRRAEAIRREIARVRGGRPVPLPPPLPVRLEALLDEFLALRSQLAREKQAVSDEVVRKRSADGPTDPDERIDWDNETRRLARVAETEYMEREAGRWNRIVDLVEDIRRETEAFAGREAAIGEGPFSDSFIDELITDRQLRRMHAEYTTAVFEPGLLPGQRRLLAGAALAEGNLPLPVPEERPKALPGR